MTDELNPPNESCPCYCCPGMIDKAVHLGKTAFRDVDVGLLKLTSDQWLFIVEAQQQCLEVTFNSVTNADIYKALRQGIKAAPKLIASGGVALVQSKDMTAPIVVMSSSDDGLSRLLVPVLPTKVMIRVTGAPRLFDVDESTPEWLLHDLRLDLLLFIHEFNQHASLD